MPNLTWPRNMPTHLRARTSLGAPHRNGQPGRARVVHEVELGIQHLACGRHVCSPACIPVLTSVAAGAPVSLQRRTGIYGYITRVKSTILLSGAIPTSGVVTLVSTTDPVGVTEAFSVPGPAGAWIEVEQTIAVAPAGGAAIAPTFESFALTIACTIAGTSIVVGGWVLCPLTIGATVVV